MAVLPDIASEAGFRPSGIKGDPAEIESATTDYHESGASRNEITPGVKHR